MGRRAANNSHPSAEKPSSYVHFSTFSLSLRIANKTEITGHNSTLSFLSSFLIFTDSPIQLLDSICRGRKLYYTYVLHVRMYGISEIGDEISNLEFVGAEASFERGTGASSSLSSGRRVCSGILPAAVNLARKSISLTLIGPRSWWTSTGDPRKTYRDSFRF